VLRNRTPNVAIASGDLYPDGVDVHAANPALQATVRPLGWLFRPSPGYPTVRQGNHKIDLAHPQGNSLHFTPLRFAEDLNPAHAVGGGPPALVDTVKGGDMIDLADLPGSEYLDGEGKMPGALAASNYGPYIGDGGGPAPTGDVQRHGGNVRRDMGDREAHRPNTQAFYDRLALNPVAMLRVEWQKNPLVAVLWGGALVAVGSLLVGNIERSFQGRNRGRGVAATAGAAPAAAAEGTGRTVNTSAKAASSAVEAVAEAAEKTVEAAGDATEKVTEAVADATS
jgi:hypothetical protein